MSPDLVKVACANIRRNLHHVVPSSVHTSESAIATPEVTKINGDELCCSVLQYSVYISEDLMVHPTDDQLTSPPRKPLYRCTADNGYRCNQYIALIAPTQRTRHSPLTV